MISMKRKIKKKKEIEVLVRDDDLNWIHPRYSGKSDEYAVLVNHGIVIRRIREDIGFYYLVALGDCTELERYLGEEADLPPPVTSGWMDADLDYAKNGVRIIFWVGER